MAFQEVSSLDADETIALGKKDKKTGKPYPKQVEGYYLGTRTVENKRGESKLHFLRTSKGNLGIWGTTDLNRKLGGVVSGTMVRITSTGTRPTPNGDMYTYLVEQDKENTIPVNLSTNDYQNSSSSDNNDDDYVSNDNDEDTSYTAPVAVSASRKAEVEAFLKSRTKN